MIKNQKNKELNNPSINERLSFFKNKVTDKFVYSLRDYQLKKNKLSLDPRVINLTKLKRDEVYAKYAQTLQEYKALPNGEEIIKEAIRRADADMEIIQKKYPTTINANYLFNKGWNCCAMSWLFFICVLAYWSITQETTIYSGTIDFTNPVQFIKELIGNRNITVKDYPITRIGEALQFASLGWFSTRFLYVLLERKIVKKQLTMDVLNNEFSKELNDFISK